MVKYLGLNVLGDSRYIEVRDLSDNIRKFFSQYNNISTTVGCGTRELCAVRLCKVYCSLVFRVVESESHVPESESESSF